MSDGPSSTPGPEITKTIVSPDVVPIEVAANIAGSPVILIPMAEWKQCAQRGFRTFMQAAAFLLGGGTVAAFSSGIGIPPASVAGLPSSGNPVADAVLYSIVFGLLVALWNACEFALDIDIHAPGWRA
jgi:hypothetical protein